MSRRVHTADDVLGLARAGRTELVVAPGDLVTPLARDVAAERGLRITLQRPDDPGHGAGPASGGPLGAEGRPALRHMPGANLAALDPFPVELHRPEMDVRLLDVVTGEHGFPMAAGVMSLRAGSFPWTLDYDEVEYVIEGELHITTADRQVVGRPGDVIAVPKGSSITFGTPSWAKFLYVTYPADWSG
ncbi:MULTISPECIES: cupin domain-containing protein [unclassified Nocardioides]|uniref:cupin domain-containing protein n=1 Tax=unclassified Nocardioides TaxID=2615069 RepID=UPI000057139E|nr:MULTISPECIES: cupin domain-containing protein [unclassified Nocardioides]ABL83526.1 Ethanolamine utilization EutQ family protein [Nocardioides sp. JS614]